MECAGQRPVYPVSAELSVCCESVSVSSQGSQSPGLALPAVTCVSWLLTSDPCNLLLGIPRCVTAQRPSVSFPLAFIFHSVKTIKNSYSGVLCLLVYSLLLSLQASEVAATKASRGRSKGSLIIECEICAKRFRYQSDMKNHYESHFRTPARR